MTRRRAGGKARKAVFLSQALSHVAAVWGCSRARVGLAEGVQGPSGGLLVGGGVDRAQGGGDPLAVPVGDEPHGWRGPGWTTQVGTMESGQVAPGGLGQAGRPVAAHDQHAPSTPLLAGPGAHAAPFKEAPSPSWIQILKPRA